MNSISSKLWAFALIAVNAFMRLIHRSQKSLRRIRRRLQRRRRSLGAETSPGFKAPSRNDHRLGQLRQLQVKEFDRAVAAGKCAKRLLSEGNRKAALFWFRKSLRHWSAVELYGRVHRRWRGTSNPAASEPASQKKAA